MLCYFQVAIDRWMDEHNVVNILYIYMYIYNENLVIKNNEIMPFATT